MIANLKVNKAIFKQILTSVLRFHNSCGLKPNFKNVNTNSIHIISKKNEHITEKEKQR